MTLTRLLLVPALLALSALPAAAEKISLATLSAYLNGLTTAETTFTQVNSDGTTSGGTLYIHRPNRMRFEYQPPDRTLVLASGRQVAIYDPKSNQPPEQYPLKRTPLNLILGDRVNLDTARMVVAHGEVDGLTTVTAQDPENPDYGTITLYFAPGPVLVKWIVTDDLGQGTEVVLDSLTTGNTYPPSLFSIEMETQRRIGG
ncbi:MAG: outer rane lipoprotein carrier protein LolA [Pseudomonadota bacterium]